MEDLLLLLVKDVLLLSVLEEAFVLLGSILFLKLLALLFQKQTSDMVSAKANTVSNLHLKICSAKNKFVPKIAQVIVGDHHLTNSFSQH